MMFPLAAESVPSVRVPSHAVPTQLDVPAGAGVRWFRYVPTPEIEQIDGRDGGTVPAPAK